LQVLCCTPFVKCSRAPNLATSRFSIQWGVGVGVDRDQFASVPRLLSPRRSITWILSTAEKLMVEPNIYSPTCPSRRALDRIGDRWTALILGILEDGPRRFAEIRDAIGITPKVLAQTLRALEADGLVVRRAYPEIPPRVKYELTPLGLTLREPLGAIRGSAEMHIHEIIAAREWRESAQSDS
jgi:DNA-binding HxlR family transcriptional regulator